MKESYDGLRVEYEDKDYEKNFSLFEDLKTRQKERTAAAVKKEQEARKKVGK